MHEWGDSGITAVLLAIGVALLLSFVLAQQARTRATRYKEIRLLQSIAAEQARREEEESHAEYSSMVASRNYCAVCFNPTTTRCSRCKAVRYCSSTCQVKHWKDGHKQECRAPDPVPSPGSSSNGSRSFSEAFSSSGSSGSGGSRSQSEASENHSGEEPTLAELARISTPTANGNGVLLGPKKVLFPYDYFVKFFNWERLKVPPCGLLNCGNSCFANAVLQCLTYTRPLTAYLLEGTHGEECRRSDWCFMCELQDHVWRVRQSQNPFSPIRILSRIRHIGNHLGYGRQEDAHEFMRFAIDSMQSICLDEAGGEKAVEPRLQETTFIHYIFGGHLQSQVKCIQCLHESNRYENMMDLAVEIQGCVESLEDGLTQFTAPEWLDGENKYKCDRCNAYVKARKRLTLHEAPNILTIALKRFQSGKFGKLNKRVTFPEVLDVSPYMSGKGDRPPLYKLYAVVVHVDMLNASFFGHYICYVKDSQGLWYKIDDSKVKEVDLEKVLAQRAYMLFYTRSTARPPPHIDGVVSPYPVSEAIDLGRVGSDRQGGLKVFPSSHYVDSEEMLDGGGTQGLHAMVDFNQMVDYVEDNPQTVTEQHMHSNGEITTTHPTTSSWEAERARSSFSNDDEIEIEDAACIASSSSSLTQTSPYMTSFTSNQGLWIPTQGFVCQVPDAGAADGTEYAAWDAKASLNDDFSEVSLQPGAVDDNKPCSNSTKIGKRRLEDGLSPLPIPKPLDTDQLPAWPAGAQGRANSCLPPVHHMSSAGPIVSSMPDESHSMYGPELTGDPISSGAFPVQRTVSTEFLSSVGESSMEAEMADYITVETAVSEEEAMAARAKRQHVEFESELDAIIRLQRPGAILQAVEHSNSSDLEGGTDMDWDAALHHPGLVKSGSNLESVAATGLRGEDPYADTTSQPSAHVHARLNEQAAALQGPLSSEFGGLAGSSPSGAAEVDKIEESSQGTAVAMDSSAALPLPSDPPGGLLQEVLEAAACSTEVIKQGQPSQAMDRDVLIGHESDIIAPSEQFLSTDIPAAAVKADNGSVPHSNGPVPLEAGKPTPPVSRKPKSKPLFAPGFLNKARIPPPGLKGKSSSSHTPSKAVAVDNGHSGNVNAAQACEAVAVNDQKCISNEETSAKDVVVVPEEDQPRPPEGISLDSVEDDASTMVVDDDASTIVIEDDASTVSSNGTERSCGNCMNCEMCTSAYANGHLENGYRALSGGAAPHLSDNHRLENGSEIEHGSSSSKASRLKAGVNSNGSAVPYSPVGYHEEEPSVEQVSDSVAAASSRLASGKQKQGRNETCNCGSQRKWKKCCGKTGALQPERQSRRVVV